MIIIINGAPGSGKSKTAELLNKLVSNSAWIDGDWLLRINPRENTNAERDLRYLQIFEVARNYFKNGYQTIFISFVYVGDSSLKNQIDLLSNIDQVKVFCLIPNDESLAKRHTGDSYVREGIESSKEINNSIKKLTGVTSIDNSDISLEETATHILNQIQLGKVFAEN